MTQAEKLREYANMAGALAIRVASELTFLTGKDREAIERVSEALLKAKGILGTSAAKMEPRKIEGLG
jgi:hypothetical protein